MDKVQCQLSEHSVILLPSAGQNVWSLLLHRHVCQVFFLLLLPRLSATAEELVNKKMEEIQDKVHLKQDVEGAYLTHLLLSEKMTVTEVLGSITELLLAGVDTVGVKSAL